MGLNFYRAINVPESADGGFYLDTTVNIIAFFKGQMSWTNVILSGCDRTVIWQFPIALIATVFKIFSISGMKWIYIALYFPLYVWGIYKLSKFWLEDSALDKLLAIGLSLTPLSLWIYVSQYWSDFPSLVAFIWSLNFLLRWLTRNSFKKDNVSVGAFVFLYAISVMTHVASSGFYGIFVIFLLLFKFRKISIFTFGQIKNHQRGLFSGIILSTLIAIIFKLNLPLRYERNLLSGWSQGWYKYGTGAFLLGVKHPLVIQFFVCLNSILEISAVLWVYLIYLSIFSKDRVAVKNYLIFFLQIMFIAVVIFFDNLPNYRYFDPLIILSFIAIFHSLQKISTRHNLKIKTLFLITLLFISIPGINFRYEETVDSLMRNLEKPIIGSGQINFMPVIVPTLLRPEHKIPNLMDPELSAIAKTGISNSNIAVLDPQDWTPWGGFEAGLHEINSSQFDSAIATPSLLDRNISITGRWPGEGKISSVFYEVEHQNISGLLNAKFIILPGGNFSQPSNQNNNNIWRIDTRLESIVLQFPKKKLLYEQKGFEDFKPSALYEILNQQEWKAEVVNDICGLSIDKLGGATKFEICGGGGTLGSTGNIVPDPDPTFNIESARSVNVKNQSILHLHLFEDRAPGLIHIHFINQKLSNSKCVFKYVDRQFSGGKDIWVETATLAIRPDCHYYVRLLPIPHSSA